jgi:ATP-dependent Lon protease
MNIELQKLELKNDIQSKVRFDLDQQQENIFFNNK